MKKIGSILRLEFLPTSVDLALLVLRLWLGLSMLLLHGWGKAMAYKDMPKGFYDPFGVGNEVSWGLAVFAEVVCSVLLVLGLFTRIAALGCAATMATAFWYAHGGNLTGPNNGEMPFLFLGVFVALFIAGAGKYSLDAKLGAKG